LSCRFKPSIESTSLSFHSKDSSKEGGVIFIFLYSFNCFGIKGAFVFGL
jgi:hypothetical protein